MHSTRLSPHWGATANPNISSPTKLIFSRDAQIPTLVKFIYDLILQSDNKVYLWCKTIGFLAIICGWVDLNRTIIKYIFVCQVVSLKKVLLK